ncbi:hypothetical protein EDC04DRAFT_2603749 [Pisolithus marmoratus]|nr:hypothetical protein EDC04DRAFT_2603749 [Pisolithus marmoratus]
MRSERTAILCSVRQGQDYLASESVFLEFRGQCELLIRDALGILQCHGRGVIKLLARFVSRRQGRRAGALVVGKLGDWTSGDLTVERCEDEGGHGERERRVEELYDILALAQYVEEKLILVTGVVDRVLGDDDSADDVEEKRTGGPRTE